MIESDGYNEHDGTGWARAEPEEDLRSSLEVTNRMNELASLRMEATWFDEGEDAHVDLTFSLDGGTLHVGVPTERARRIGEDLIELAERAERGERDLREADSE